MVVEKTYLAEKGLQLDILQLVQKISDNTAKTEPFLTLAGFPFDGTRKVVFELTGKGVIHSLFINIMSGSLIMEIEIDGVVVHKSTANNNLASGLINTALINDLGTSSNVAVPNPNSSTMIGVNAIRTYPFINDTAGGIVISKDGWPFKNNFKLYLYSTNASTGTAVTHVSGGIL